MKHPFLLALPILAVVASASAQTSVTAYGFIELAAGKNPGNPDKGLIDSAGSRLGFKGEEDLGGGLRASFLIEHRFNPDTGTVNGGATFWKGGSWVGLSGALGKVTLGRWWTQAFLKSQFASDPFGMATVGLSYGTVGCGGSPGCVGAFWMNDSLSYETASGPFSAGVQVAERAPGDVDRPWNFGASYAQGGLYLGLGHEDPGGAHDVWTHATVNYDFGALKLITGFGSGKDAAGDKRRNVIVGFTAPLGAGTLIGSYNQHKDAATTVQAKGSLGYQHPLSKRTKLFATVTQDSKAASSKHGFDLGIFHSW